MKHFKMSDAAAFESFFSDIRIQVRRDRHNLHVEKFLKISVDFILQRQTSLSTYN